MSSSKVLFCVALGLLAFVARTDAVCKKCSSVSYAACINETAFNVCFDGLNKEQQVGVCPKNKVCTTQAGVCKPRDSEKPDCGKCNTCLNGFACISQTEFEYCDGKTTSAVPNGITGQCPDGQYCSLANLASTRSICMKSCLGDPTCYADKATSTPTPAPGEEYTKVCTGKSTGFYENTYDSTCTTYVYCETLDNVMYAVLYKCPAGYFSATEKECTATKPSECS